MILVKEMQISDEAIRMQRARLHISQNELAKRTGLTREKITAIENAKCKKVTEETLKKLAEAFNLKLEDLLKKEER